MSQGGRGRTRAPRTYDADTAQAEGALAITLGGEKWVAPEPDNDTMKAVLACEAEWTARMDAEAAKRGEADPGSDEARSSLVAEAELGVDSLAPQLELLVFRADDNGQPVWDAPLTADFLAEHRISARQQGLLLRQILGEGDARLGT
jgi:hypothetical protein